MNRCLHAVSAAGSSYPSEVCGSVGFFLGASFAIAYRAATVRVWREPNVALNVVITGGTRGIGRALVREFLSAGDNVYIASRSAKSIRDTVAELTGECVRPRQVAGVECDVSKPSSVTRLASLAQDHFEDGNIDVWINNAGTDESCLSSMSWLYVVRSSLTSVWMIVSPAVRTFTPYVDCPWQKDCLGSPLQRPPSVGQNALAGDTLRYYVSGRCFRLYGSGATGAVHGCRCCTWLQVLYNLQVLYMAGLTGKQWFKAACGSKWFKAACAAAQESAGASSPSWMQHLTTFKP
jgi:hypothetical protein